jgi:hypothetical protein
MRKISAVPPETNRGGARQNQGERAKGEAPGFLRERWLYLPQLMRMYALGIDLKRETNRQGAEKNSKASAAQDSSEINKRTKWTGKSKQTVALKTSKKAKQQKLANTHTHKLIYDTNIQRSRYILNKKKSREFVSSRYLTLPSTACSSRLLLRLRG